MAEYKVLSDAFSLEKATVNDLKRFLRDRGIPVTGTKAVLIDRAKGALNLRLRTLKDISQQDDNDSKQRTVEKLQTPLGEKLPNPIELKQGWTNDYMKIPPFTDNELYNYLVLNKLRTIDGASNRATRQLKAKVFLEDNNVYQILYHPVSDTVSHAFVKCKVIKSFPTQSENKQPDYTVWICLSKVSGRVHSASCSCEAGDGESCNHIAGLMYALVEMTEKRAHGLDAVTSSECKSNKPRKRRLTPKKSQELVFKKHKFETETEKKDKKCKQKLFNEKSSKDLDVKPVDLNCFSQKLKKCNPHAAWLTTLEGENEEPESSLPVLPKLHNILYMYSDSVDLNGVQCQSAFKEYFDQLTCDEDSCTTIEKLTRGQSKNEMWFEAREGRLTSSVFGQIVRKKESTSPNYLIRTAIGYSSFESEATKWGKKHEAAARRIYSRAIQKDHPHMKVKQCGLIVNSCYPHLASSPDGLLSCSCEKCNGPGVLEIKCPYKFRLKSVEGAAVDPTFCCYVENGIVRLKRSHIYYVQVQGQMAVSKCQWCDFFVWTLQGYSIERIQFDEDFWKSCLSKLNSFYVTFILPELFTDRVKRGRSLELD